MLSADAVKRAALEARFSLVGLAPAGPLDPAPLRRWLDAGMAADMAWMQERFEERTDPRRLFPKAKTVMALGACYMTAEHAKPSPIALYARGRDYHATLRDRLRALRRALVALSPSLDTYGEVDTGPVMEKAWAERAGLGWIGKNGLLLTREHGSYVMLAVMLLSEEVDRYDAPHRFLCGDCTACLDRCPTKAIVSPGVVDARLCLSYETIENRGPSLESTRPHTAGLGFGCDHCQTVCPWTKLHDCGDDRFLPREIASLSLPDLARLTPERFTQLTQGTAVARAKYDGLRRNALLALGAEGHPETTALATTLLEDPSELVRDAARWALDRVRS